jgi:hypothetical protein
VRCQITSVALTTGTSRGGVRNAGATERPTGIEVGSTIDAASIESAV